MTRGQIVAITDDAIFTSTEFNGDMYYEWHGKEVMEGLKKASTIKEYSAFVKSFNEYHFHYKEQLLYKITDEEQIDSHLDFTQNYFKNWFSDYLYIKNYGSEPVELITKTHTITLKPNGITILNYGEVCEETCEYSIDNIMYSAMIMKNGTNTFFITCPSWFCSPTVVATATTLLGQIKFPSAAPAFCEANTTFAFNAKAPVASKCIGENIIFEPSPVPVINEPIEPIITAAAG